MRPRGDSLAASNSGRFWSCDVPCVEAGAAQREHLKMDGTTGRCDIRPDTGKGKPLPDYNVAAACRKRYDIMPRRDVRSTARALRTS